MPGNGPLTVPLESHPSDRFVPLLDRRTLPDASPRWRPYSLTSAALYQGLVAAQCSMDFAMYPTSTSSRVTAKR